MLSSAAFFAQPTPANVDTVLWWVGDDDRALLRELIYLNFSAAEATIFVYLETPEATSGFIHFGKVPAFGMLRLADLFVVMEPGWKLHVLQDASSCTWYGAGHHWPGAGSAVD